MARVFWLRALGLSLGLALGGGCPEHAPPPEPDAGSPGRSVALGLLEPTPGSQPTRVPSVDPTAAPPSAEPAPPLPEPAPPLPAFVLYTIEQTVVIPFDGTRPTRAEGMWVQDDRGTETSWAQTIRMTPHRAEVMGIPPCPCVEIDGACTMGQMQTTRFDPNTGGTTSSPQPGCRCWLDDEPVFMPPPAEPGFDGERFTEPCPLQMEVDPVSLVGGRLFLLGFDWNHVCFGGMSVYDALALEEPLVTKPPEFDVDADMVDVGCTYDAWVDAPWPLVLRSFRSSCEDINEWGAESDVVVLRRGRLWRVSDTIGHAGGTRRLSRRKARPDRCPSANDPCGDPAPFLAREGFDRREYWVSTDGAAALSATRRRYQLWRSAAEPPTVFELTGIDASRDVIGIRVHADVGPLRRAMSDHASLGTVPAPGALDPEQCRVPEPFKTDRDFVDSKEGRGWGNRCFAHIGRKHWSAAEAACRRGLAMATDNAVRGALLYNLGRVAEGRGAHRRAAALYEESLAARPGNRQVERRLARLPKTDASAGHCSWFD